MGTATAKRLDQWVGGAESHPGNQTNSIQGVCMGWIPRPGNVSPTQQGSEKDSIFVGHQFSVWQLLAHQRGWETVPSIFMQNTIGWEISGASFNVKHYQPPRGRPSGFRNSGNGCLVSSKLDRRHARLVNWRRNFNFHGANSKT